MNKKILVTGGAGFIGSELVHQLADSGSHVIVVDNLVNGKRENIEDILSERVTLHETDIRDKAAIVKLLQDIDVVFHLACLGVRHSIHSPIENHDVNATATLNLLAWARDANVQRFVYVSSSEVYGTAQTVPMSENHPAFPMTVYGSSKLAGECYTRAYYRTYKFPTTIVRPFNTYGPRCHHEGDSGEVIPKFMLRTMAGLPMVVFGDGNQTRDFTYVSDTADGIVKAGLSENTIGETINLGASAEIRINDLADAIKEIIDNPSAALIHETARPGDVLRLFADTKKAQDLIGYQPQVSFREGLKKLHNWYIQSGKDPKDLLSSETVLNWKTDNE